MSDLILPASMDKPQISVVQDPANFKWAGIPFHKRYCPNRVASRGLVRDLRKIDDKLDLKFYLPLSQWHLVRYIGNEGKFTQVWKLEDAPEKGLRKEPGSWMIEALKMADTRGRNLEAELDAIDAMAEKSINDQIADAALEFAKDIRKPLQALYNYGPQHDYKGVWASGA